METFVKTMRFLATAAALALAAASIAAAQPDQRGPAPTPPRAFQESGYSEPDITPGLCKIVDSSHAQCTIPEMTAGRYYIEAAGTSKATDAGAAQQLTILVGEAQCAQGARGTDAKNPWAAGEPRTLKLGCVTSVVTDRALEINVFYADAKATKDSKGPIVSVRRLPWGGVLTMAPVVPKQ